MTERQKAIEEGAFETKVFAPSMETKPAAPPPARKVENILDRVEAEIRKDRGTPVSQERKRELQRRLDSVIQRIRALRRGNTRKVRERRSEATTGRQKESQLPASETYWAAWRMRSLCIELIGDLLPKPTPLVKWRSPEALARKYRGDRRTVGLCSKNGGQVMVELSSELSPRDAATVCAHELCHASQFYGGVGRVNDREREAVGSRQPGSASWP